MRLEMSLSPGKYQRRYSKGLSEQWGGASSCWYITEFMSTPRFFLSAGMNLVQLAQCNGHYPLLLDYHFHLPRNMTREFHFDLWYTTQSVSPG